jgi:hypothetical protein
VNNADKLYKEFPTRTLLNSKDFPDLEEPLPDPTEDPNVTNALEIGKFF